MALDLIFFRVQTNRIFVSSFLNKMYDNMLDIILNCFIFNKDLRHTILRLLVRLLHRK